MAMEEERPIIGILAQEATAAINKKYPYCKSYIAASYVKAIESSGARVIPIFLDKTEEYYRAIIYSINGLVLPGGNTWFYKFDDKTPKENGYLRAAEILYTGIKKINNETKDSFPILGICLGLEVMLFIDAQKQEYRDTNKLHQLMLSLKLHDNYENSRLFGNLNEHEKQISETLKEAVHYFSHQFYITKETLKERFHEEWKILSTSEHEDHNVPFISIIESKEYPFLGLQFHPEKIYEWSTKVKSSHSPEAITTCRFIFDWLIKQSKRNKNKFSNEELENKSLIYNHKKTFASPKLNFDELYLFDENNTSLILIKQSSLIQCVL